MAWLIFVRTRQKALADLTNVGHVKFFLKKWFTLNRRSVSVEVSGVVVE